MTKQKLIHSILMSKIIIIKKSKGEGFNSFKQGQTLLTWIRKGEKINDLWHHLKQKDIDLDILN